jgi:flagellar protein FlaJ
MRAKSRKRSINTNLPFAIDHMSSVISSGVSPATMFKLISNSKEYGEISIEIDKVSNYVEFFGYDILTALRAVALITPSEEFKEFIDGFVSTIETGGDLKGYLAQKSSEALLNYRLERQKYVEALSTYSDIYTGVLIAAPLFFVIALSLVSVIGGNIGGFSVGTIISFGTYLIIPLLNMAFLIFLEASQPEV